MHPKSKIESLVMLRSWPFESISTKWTQEWKIHGISIRLVRTIKYVLKIAVSSINNKSISRLKAKSMTCYYCAMLPPKLVLKNQWGRAICSPVICPVICWWLNRFDVLIPPLRVLSLCKAIKFPAWCHWKRKKYVFCELKCILKWIGRAHV